MQVKSKTSQSETVFKSLPRLSTQFRVKESFKPSLAKLVIIRNFANNSRNSLATQTSLNFGGPCRRIRPAKLTNYGARTNLEIFLFYYYNNIPYTVVMFECSSCLLTLKTQINGTWIILLLQINIAFICMYM